MLSCDRIEVRNVEPTVVNTNQTGQTVEIRICRHQRHRGNRVSLVESQLN